MPPIRVGVAGVGHWARSAHLPAVAAHPDAELVALADPEPANLERGGSRYGVTARFRDAREMIETCDLDAVVVATPHRFHYEIAAAAIARGRHVLIEKPMVLDPADGRRLIAAAGAAGVEIVVGYTWHYNRQVLRARAWIADGRIGPIRYVQSFFGSSPVNLYRGQPEADAYAYGEGAAFDGPLPTTYSDPALAGGGQGQTQLTHSIALLLFLTGLVPVRVGAFMDDAGTQVDVVDALALRFEGGALGAIGSTGAVTPVSHTDTLEYIIHGTRGHLHFDVMDGTLRLYADDGPIDDPGLPAEERYPMAAPATNLIDLALGRAPNGSPPSYGQLTVATLAAAYRSAAGDGAPVDIDIHDDRSRGAAP
jgi:predicted dehydrogenase